MSDRVRERGLFSHQKVTGQPFAVLKSVPQQILALAVDIHFDGRIESHYIGDKIQIAEWHARLHGMNGNTPVGAEYVIHVQLTHPFFRFRLKLRRRRSKIRVLVSEQLVGHLAGEQHPHIGMLMDVLAAQVHPHAGADRRNVVRSQRGDDLRKIADHVVSRDDDGRVIRAEIVRRLLRIFEVNGIHIHPDRECPDRAGEKTCRDRAYKRGVESSGQQEADRRVRIQPLVHRTDQKLPDLRGGFIRRRMDDLRRRSAASAYAGIIRRIEPAAVRRLFFKRLSSFVNLRVPREDTVLPVAARREWHHPAAESHQILRFRGEDNGAVLQIAVMQRPDADRIAGRDKGTGLRVIDHHRKLGVQHGEHPHSVLVVKRQDDLTVRAAAEHAAVLDQFPAKFPETVKFAVAHHHISVQMKRLHALLREAHDGQTLKAEPAVACFFETHGVRSSGCGLEKRFLRTIKRGTPPCKTHNRTHLTPSSPPEKAKDSKPCLCA